MNARQRVNSSINAKGLFLTMRMEGEKKVRNGVDKATASNIKKGPLKRLNDYVNPVLADQDPEQCIEEEYKRKHQQVFCWRFLRTLSYIDQSTYYQKKGNAGENKVKTFNGDVELLASQIHEQAKKREIQEGRPEDEHEQDEEELATAQPTAGGPGGPGSASGSTQVKEELAAKKITSNEQAQGPISNGTSAEPRPETFAPTTIEEIQEHVQRQKRRETKN